MSVVRAIFKHFLAFLMSIILTAIPYAGRKEAVIQTLHEDCLLNLELISDTHVEKNEPFRKAFLKWGLQNLAKAECPVDGILVSGDITNYADDPSLTAYYDIIKKYSPAPVVTAPGNHDIGHAGDRGKTDMTREEAKENFIRHRNEFKGIDDTTIYYSEEIKGYKCIVLGDEVIDGGHWDAADLSAEQIAFLDRELAEGTKDGKPVFVICHYPVDGTNGEQIIWEDNSIDLTRNDIKSVMEKYPNVFYISGHLHAGIKSTAVEKYFGLSNAEKINGVTYLNLPTYGIVNTFGNPFPCIGAQLEVYENEVVFRPRNFVTNRWLENSEFHFDLDR